MVQLELTDEQAQLLSDVLSKVLGDLSYEIRDTDTRTFRDDLKRRREMLQEIAEQLPAQES